MGYEVRLVLGLEFRRYLRSRRFWRVLMTSVGSIGVFTMILSGLVLYLPPELQDGARSATYLFDIWWVLWSLIYSIAHMILTREVFSDSYRTRPLVDLYLLPLHPLSIVLGRLLTVWLMMGLMMLLSLPCVLFVGGFVGVSLQEMGLTLFWSWLSFLVAGSILALTLWKWFPEGLTSGLSPTAGTSHWLLVIAGLGWFGWLLGSTALTGDSYWLPVGFLFPMTVPQMVWETTGMGRWLLGLLFLGTVFGLAVVGTAQRLGWWSGQVFAWLRGVGTLVIWFWYGFHLWLLSSTRVRAVSTAEHWLHWGMSAGGFLLAITTMPVLGYFAVGRLNEQGARRLSPIGRGLVLEWVFFTGIGMLVWVAIGWGSGFWVSVEAWLSHMVYLWATLAFLQSIYGPYHLFSARLVRAHSEPIWGIEYRLWLAHYFNTTVGIIMTLWFIWFLMKITASVLGALASSALKPIAGAIVLIHPLNGWASSGQSTLWYWQYAGYTLVLTSLRWAYIGGCWLRSRRLEAASAVQNEPDEAQAQGVTPSTSPHDGVAK